MVLFISETMIESVTFTPWERGGTRNVLFGIGKHCVCVSRHMLATHDLSFAPVFLDTLQSQGDTCCLRTHNYAYKHSLLSVTVSCYCVLSIAWLEDNLPHLKHAQAN
jgi:hypothetical protein